MQRKEENTILSLVALSLSSLSADIFLFPTFSRTLMYKGI